jgi:hypothetical protein
MVYYKIYNMFRLYKTITALNNYKHYFGKIIWSHKILYKYFYNL